MPTTPVHVGLKVATDISNLRHPDLFGPLREAIYEGSDRLGMRIIHFSVVEDHLHFIVEAAGREALARGMQGLAVRLAKRINKVLGRRGKVFIDRYFSRVLCTPSEVRICLSYVLKNKLRHNRQRGIVHGSLGGLLLVRGALHQLEGDRGDPARGHAAHRAPTLPPAA